MNAVTVVDALATALVAGIIAFAVLRGSTSPLTVENDTASFVQVVVANGCSRDSSICDNRPVGIYIMGRNPGQVGHARRACGHVGPEQVLGFVSGGGARRCLVSLDGGSHALVSQGTLCPLDSAGAPGHDASQINGRVSQP
jgi:hypothetical protein